MWLVLAFLSAALLGFYDSFKKKALASNAVIPVLFLNTLFSSLIFLPFIVVSYTSDALDNSIFLVGSGGWETHKYVVLKSFIVLSSWVLGYFGMKHLPLTIVGPINATRPVMVLVGAMLFFVFRRRCRDKQHLIYFLFKFFKIKRSVIIGGGQAEAIFHKVCFSCSVTVEHSSDLRNGNMGFIYHN